MCVISDSMIDLRLGGVLIEAEEETSDASKRPDMAGGIEDWEDLEGHDIDRLVQSGKV
jgi:hypothetical protein